MSKPTESGTNHAQKVFNAAFPLASKHFRWLSRAALDAMVRDTEKLEARLATAYTLKQSRAGVTLSDDDVREMESSLAAHRDIVTFARALDEAVAELAVTASVSGWKTASAVLTKWMRTAAG